MMRFCYACQTWLEDSDGQWIKGKCYCDYNCYYIETRQYDKLKVNVKRYRQAMPDDDFL